MSEKIIEVKQSKKYVILTCIGALIIIAFLIGICIFFIHILICENETKDNVIGISISLCTFLIFLTIILIMLVVLLWSFIYRRDVYTETKIIRTVKGKIKFELPYSNIITIHEGFESLFMVLKTPIIEANGKKGTRNFYAHYSKADISRIQRMITEKYYNIPFN